MMTAAKIGGGNNNSMKNPSSSKASTRTGSSSSGTMRSQPPTTTTGGHNNNNNNNNNSISKKNVDNTVFVRFVPPSNNIRRHHVEELFSCCGPIKKSSIIHTNNNNNNNTPKDEASNEDHNNNTATTTAVVVPPSSSYGFVKYTSYDDAKIAAEQLNNRTLTIDGITVIVKVELASNNTTTTKKELQPPPKGAEMSNQNNIQNNNNNNNNNNNVRLSPIKPTTPKNDSNTSQEQRGHSKQGKNTTVADNNHTNDINTTRPITTTDETTTKMTDIKKTNRLIIRNLSFYAKESDIRNTLQTFGTIVDIHIPKVVTNVQPPTTTTTTTQRGKVMAPTHRGFAFVTFATEAETDACLQQQQYHNNNQGIMIKERVVQISRSLHKTAHQQQQQQQDQQKTTYQKADTNNEKLKKVKKKDQDNEEIDENEEKDVDDDDVADEHDEDEEEEEEDDLIENGKKNTNATKDDTAIVEGRCLFVRNLPFDCTRHDIFDTFRTFGHITSIFIVKTEASNSNSSNVKTLLPKGTAFVTFQKKEHAKKALIYANPTRATTTTSDTTNFVSQRTATSAMMMISENAIPDTDVENFGGIVMKGRRLLVDAAVDKETASTLIGGEKNADKIGYKDRRNLYLKNEGRVDNDEAKKIMIWDELPEGDKLKRQTAWSEKNTKLRSPLFYINPNRLSLRNLAKHIDEVALKKLIVTAIRRGLYENKLIQPDDQIAHWRASGEYTTREILAKIQEGDTNGNGIIPVFDEKNIKQSIPSLHIHRDVVSGGNKNIAPSRGFGFVEFQHHTHALACLRELNNNPLYSKEYAIGGKQVAIMKERRKRNSSKKRKIEPSEDETKINDDNYVTADGNIRTPRLIVEFTVENKAKAKQQAEHKAKQQANQIKQRMDIVTKKDDISVPKTPSSEKVRKSRGAIQREKKRQRLQEKEGDDSQPEGDIVTNVDSTKVDIVPTTTVESKSTNKKVKGVAPPKKPVKLDAEEVTFSNLVASYQRQASAAAANTMDKDGSDENPSKPKRRWYE